MATIFCVAACGLASAKVITWDGKTDPANSGKWSDPANWDTDTLPGPGDTAVIPSTGVKRIITVDVPVSIARLDWHQTQGQNLNYLVLEKDLTCAEVSFPGGGISPTHLMTIREGVKFTTSSRDRPLMFPSGAGTIVCNGKANWEFLYHPVPDFSGSWVINDGVVWAHNNDGRMGNASITINPGATLLVAEGQSTPRAYTLNGKGAPVNAGDGKMAGQGALRFTTTTISILHVVRNPPRSILITRAITLATDSDIAVDATPMDGDIVVDATLMGTIAGPIGGPGGLRKIGLGTLVIAGPSNTYAGTTTVMEGKLVVQRPVASPVVVKNGAILVGAPIFFPKNARGEPDVRVEPGGKWINGPNSWWGKGDPAVSGKWSDPANWSLGHVPGVGNHAGEDALIGSTAVSRTITVDVPVNLGTLTWQQFEGESLSSLVLKQDLSCGEVSFSGVAGIIGRTHLMTIPEGVKFTTSSQERPSMWPIGDGTIVKNGTGTWVNSYGNPGPGFSGNWVANGGVVTAAPWEGRMFNSRRITVNAGATLSIPDGGAIPQACLVNGTGFQGQGALRFTATTGSGRAITLATDSDFAVDATLTGTLSGAIGGPGGLRKIGPGTLVIAGSSNTYAGTTTVMEGKLEVQRPIAGPAVVKNGAILEGAPVFFPKNARGEPQVKVERGGKWITGPNSWWGNGNPAASGNWSDPTNWTFGHAPGVGTHTGEDALIRSTAVSRTITVDVPVNLGMLTWQQGDGENLNHLVLKQDLTCAEVSFFDVVAIAGKTHLMTIPEGVKFATKAAEELPKKIEELTGGRTKIVWEGGTHLPGSTTSNQKGDPSLIGYDTADGKSRVLSTSSNWMMPFITPDGSAVIFNMGNQDGGSKGSKIVNWDGSNERWLVQGEYGWAHCAWVDPATKITWIYVSDAAQRGWGVDKCAFTKVFRVRLDKPDVREPIYETNRGGLWLFATPDGKRLWGSIRDSQEQGMLDIATKTVTPITAGCDPSHSPTEDRFWAFTGTHRHMIMFDWKDDQAVNRRMIQANTMPGIDGRENVWHPRWSTNPRIFSIMGPEHGKAQIYLGRFNKDVTAIEAWVQVTNNLQWNGWSHAWVQAR